MDFFGELIEKVVRNGFAPLAPSEKSKTTYTLHNLIRDQLGMAERKDVQSKSEDPVESEVHITSDMADVAFWNYQDLRSFLHKVHEILNQVASEIVGRTTNAIAWSHDQTRTQDEIIDLLRRAQLKHPQMRTPNPAAKREMAKSMVQKRRVEAAIANTFAVLAGNGASYGDLFEKCSELEVTNEGLLEYLDTQIRSFKYDIHKIDSESSIPRQLVISYTGYKSKGSELDAKVPTMSDYFRYLKNSNNLAGNSNATLISRMAASSIKNENFNDD